jgi:YrbI family 3-deoxy-D-manno-octulosonate 8-phosphate phosphatase
MDKLFLKLDKIKLLLLDFDGVIIPSCEKNSEDTLEASLAALKSDVIYADKIGIKMGVISFCSDEELIIRIRNAGIKEIITGTLDKLSASESFLNKMNIDITETAYIGDDLFDIPLLQKAGFSAAPETARREVKRIVDFICRKDNKKSYAGIVLSLIKEAREFDKKSF